jgi:hypothetical protein
MLNYTLGALAWSHLITIFICASIVVVYWGRKYPATGEFQLKDALTSPFNLSIFIVALAGTIVSYKYAPQLGYTLPFTYYTIPGFAVSILALLIILEKSRYTTH